MDGVLGRLKGKLSELGITFSVWDLSQRCFGGVHPGGGFCRLVHSACQDCRRAMAQVGRKVVESGEPQRGESSFGCCLVGVPVRRRRHMLGAAVAGFPTAHLQDEELLHRLCDRLELDFEHVARTARQDCRRLDDQADDWLLLLRWLLEQEQAAQLAEEELAGLSENLATTYEELNLLYRVSGSMEVTRQPQEFLQSTCDEVREVMNIETAAAVLLASPPMAEEDIVAVAGDQGSGEAAICEFLLSQIAPVLGEERRAVLDNNCTDPFGLAILKEGVQSWIAVPLIADERLIGVLAGLNKRGRDFDSVDLKLINSIGNQVSIFLANNRLYGEMRDLLMGVLHALTSAIDAKDPYTCGHSQRVALISRRIAETYGLPAETVRRIYLSGLLHDVGKIGVPESVLSKAGRLTEQEYELIKTHPAVGAKILGGIRQLDPIIESILTHHERPDGRGYPTGLKGEEVPLEGRILGLADSFDAMTSDRTYRDAMPLGKVIDEIRANAGTQFDPEMVETLLSLDLEVFMEELKAPVRMAFPASIVGSGRA
jgi:HD-GYP domain-containing protein (c-di-GMP phosphodiesterase class II)